MSQYFHKPHEPSGGDINVKFDLSNYATKTDFKNVPHVDVSTFALKSNLASLKTEVDKLDIGKLQTVPLDLSKLSNKVANDVITKTQFSTLVSKVHCIDTTNFVSKTKYERDGSDSEDKINKVDRKILDVNDLVKKSALTAVENKMPDASDLVKKTDYHKLLIMIMTNTLLLQNLILQQRTLLMQD